MCPRGDDGGIRGGAWRGCLSQQSLRVKAPEAFDIWFAWSNPTRNTASARRRERDS